MSAEDTAGQKPSPDEPADESPAEPDAEQKPAEGPAATPAEEQPEAPTEEPTPPEGEGPPAEAPSETAEEPAPPAPTDAPEDDLEATPPTIEAELGPDEVTPPPPVQEKPEAPSPNYDGLDSGLAWLGAEPFQPPVPVGYVPGVERPPREVSAEERELRRRRIHGRFESRRKEVETQKAWYQRIPLGALSMLPILIVLAVVVILYPPWGGLPGPKEALDDKLLLLAPVADQEAALRALGIVEAMPKCWRALPGDALLMDSVERNAKLVFTVPQGIGAFEASCEICILDRDVNAWDASITLGPAAAMTMQAHPKKPGKDYVAGRMPSPTGTSLAGYECTIKPKHWYEVRIAVGAGDVRYILNGKPLKAVAPRPTSLGKIELTTYNTRLMIRHWRIKPAG